MEGKGISMERRGASHTEEEEMNQRRRLLNQARKGDPKAINRLFELYQVRVYSGSNLKKVGRLPFAPQATTPRGKGHAPKPRPGGKAKATHGRSTALKSVRQSVRQNVQKVAPRKAARTSARGKSSRKATRGAAHR